LKQAVTEGERWGPLHRECAERLREQDLIIGEQFNSSTVQQRWSDWHHATSAK